MPAICVTFCILVFNYKNLLTIHPSGIVAITFVIVSHTYSSFFTCQIFLAFFAPKTFFVNFLKCFIETIPDLYNIWVIIIGTYRIVAVWFWFFCILLLLTLLFLLFLQLPLLFLCDQQVLDIFSSFSIFQSSCLASLPPHLKIIIIR